MRRVEFGELFMAFRPADTTGKASRAQFHKTISPETVKQWAPEHIQVVCEFAARLIEDPERFRQHTRVYELISNLTFPVVLILTYRVVSIVPSDPSSSISPTEFARSPKVIHGLTW
jgi:hypothetical protein